MEEKLGNEDRTTVVEDYISKMIDKGWKDFVKSIRAENEASNRRLYRALWKIKGQLFTTEVDAFIKMKGGLPLLRIVRQPKGVMLKDNRWRSFTELWINPSGGGYGSCQDVYIQVKPERWIYFTIH